MSDDLISRSALSKKICNKECNIPKYQTDAELNAFLLGLNAKQIAVMECFSDTPTAYDVDKVVEQMEEYIRESSNVDYNRAMIEAIEIVKSGGIE